MSWKILLVWVLFIAALMFLSYFFTKRVKMNKEIRKQIQAEEAARKQKYTYLKPGIFVFLLLLQPGFVFLFLYSF